MRVGEIAAQLTLTNARPRRGLAVRELKSARPALQRARESTLLVSEEFTLQLVQGVGQKLLPGAGLAKEQHRRGSWSDTLEGGKHSADRGALTHDSGRQLRTQLFLEVGILRLETAGEL